MRRLNVVCVNWGDFAGCGDEYVANLFAGVKRNLTVPWRGVCLTDDPASVPDGIEAVELIHGFDGWWNCNQIYRPGLFPDGDRVLYFDLDTVIVGSLDDIAGYSGRFAAMDDINGPGLANGVVAFEAGAMNHIWNDWAVAGYPYHPHGDQGWVDSLERDCDRLQKLYPGQLVSFKADVFLIGRPPDNARVVYFHGHPRPHQVAADWMTKHWSGDQ